MGVISINGKTMTIPNGSSVNITQDSIIVDGKQMDDSFFADQKVFNVVIEGDVSVVDGMAADITVNGTAGSVKTMSGDVRVTGDVLGDAKTMSGDVKVKGSVSGSASSVSGNVSHRG
jgi:DUF4097 and DUF4098 domain-containing protein YvlB